jgi:hypothetical protein
VKGVGARRLQVKAQLKAMHPVHCEESETEEGELQPDKALLTRTNNKFHGSINFLQNTFTVA